MHRDAPLKWRAQIPRKRWASPTPRRLGQCLECALVTAYEQNGARYVRTQQTYKQDMESFIHLQYALDPGQGREAEPIHTSAQHCVAKPPTGMYVCFFEKNGEPGGNTKRTWEVQSCKRSIF